MSKPIVSNTLKSALPFFKIVARLPDKSRKLILNDLGGDQTAYDALHEMAYNTIKGNVKLKKSHKRKLKRHDKVLKKFCCLKNKKSLKKRKQLLIQSGGFLPILIPAVASLLTSILSKNV